MELPTKWRQRDEGIVGIRCDRAQLTYCACFLTRTHLFVDSVTRDELRSRGVRNGMLDLDSQALQLLLLRLENLFYLQDFSVQQSSVTVTLSLPPWTFDMRLASDQSLLTGFAWRQLLNHGILLRRIGALETSIDEYSRLTRRLKETLRQTQGYAIAGAKESSQHIDFNENQCWTAAVNDESTWTISEKLSSERFNRDDCYSEEAQHSSGETPAKDQSVTMGNPSSFTSPGKGKRKSTSPFYTSPVKFPRVLLDGISAKLPPAEKPNPLDGASGFSASPEMMAPGPTGNESFHNCIAEREETDNKSMSRSSPSKKRQLHSDAKSIGDPHPAEDGWEKPGLPGDSFASGVRNGGSISPQLTDSSATELESDSHLDPDIEVAAW